MTWRPPFHSRLLLAARSAARPRLVIAFLAAGLLSSLALAWVCRIRALMRPTSIQSIASATEGSQSWSVQWWEQFGRRSYVVFPQNQGSSSRLTFPGAIGPYLITPPPPVPRPSVTPLAPIRLPPWVTRPTLSGTASTGGYGWPFLAWKHSLLMASSNNAQTYVGSLRLDLDLLDLPNAQLPITPMPLGLIADSLLCAALWALVFTVASATLGRHREIHGRCAGCGYSLTGLPPNAPCPECGHAHP